MIVTFFSIGCLICLSFLTGLFAFAYLRSQLNYEDEKKCYFEPENKIGYKRKSIK